MCQGLYFVFTLINSVSMYRTPDKCQEPGYSLDKSLKSLTLWADILVRDTVIRKMKSKVTGTWTKGDRR